MQYLLRKSVFAVIFAIILIALTVINVPRAFPSFIEEAENTEGLTTSSVESLVNRLENVMDERFSWRTALVETYAYAQRLLGKREIYQFQFVKDDNGYLHETVFYEAEDGIVETLAMRVRVLQEQLLRKGTRLLVVIPPAKYQPGYTQADPAWALANPERNVNELMYYLDSFGVDAIDFNRTFPNEEIPYEECFYKTERFWTIPAAFRAARDIVGWVDRVSGTRLDPDGVWLSDKSFEKVTYPGGMLGSEGRRTGEAFAGREDFVALWPAGGPQVERLRYLEKSRQVFRGTIMETLIDRSVAENESGIGGRSAYASYMGDEYSHEVMTNLDMPDGPRLLLVRDSYFSPMIPFLMPMFGVIDSIWSEHEDTYYGLSNALAAETFDYVIVEVDPYRINNEAFDFCVKEADRRIAQLRMEEEEGL